MTRKQKKMLIRIITSAVLMISAKIFNLNGTAELIVYLLSYFIIGWDILWKAIRNIFRGQVFDENFLMAIATIGAMFTGEFSEAVAVMVFYQTGELFQNYAVGRSRKSIAELMDIRPDYANIEQNGEIIQVDPEEIKTGDVIIVQAGEKIPLDGIIVNGKSSVDTSALTGESVPRDLKEGDEIISGCINLTGVLKIKVTKEFNESTVSKILELVENSSSRKAKSENFITRFARYYTPCVVIGAVLLATIPPILTGGNWNEWIHRALIFLVVSCPCALVISVPLSFFGGIGGASKYGILIKGGNYLESLASAETVVFDKTGTLTKGVFKVTEIHTENDISEEMLLEYTALAESYSNHPVSRSLKNAYGKNPDKSRVENTEEISGKGVKALIDGKIVFAGNYKLMQENSIQCKQCSAVGTIVYTAIGGKYAGYIIISDEIKEDSADTISKLKEKGIRKTVMLTGDCKNTGENIAEILGIDEVHTELMPTDKVKEVEKLLEEKSSKGKLIFVGDGINDAPVLSRADIGIAMGGIGSDAAIEAADIVIMDDKPSKIVKAVELSRKTLNIVKQNIVFALSVKALVLILGAFGIAGMWSAVFADVGVSVLAILNAMRVVTSSTISKHSL